MNEALAYLVVFAAAATPWLEVVVVVPAALVAGLPPVPAVLVAILGNLASMVPVVVGGHRLRARWRARRGNGVAAAAPGGERRASGDEPPARREGGERDRPAHAPAPDADAPRGGRGARARRLFERYGVLGLAALGPLLTGVHLAAVAALATGAGRRRVLGWLSAGVVAWAVAAAVVTALGIDALVDPASLPDLGLR